MSTQLINREGKVKLFLSLSLLAYASYTAHMANNMSVIFAMLLSTIGDIFIMESRGVFEEQKRDSFTLGVIAFALAHLFYIIAIETKYSNYIAAGTIILVLITMYLAVAKKTRDTKACFIPYALCILSNAVNSWIFGLIAGLGMTLFIASDVILSLTEERNPKWQIAIWATYVPAQALLITSILLK